jgi:hypothetical protein
MPVWDRKEAQHYGFVTGSDTISIILNVKIMYSVKLGREP